VAEDGDAQTEAGDKSACADLTGILGANGQIQEAWFGSKDADLARGLCYEFIA